MIGIVADNSDEEIVTEFFELFKTPWSFYIKEKPYNVIITSDINLDETDAKLIICFTKNPESQTISVTEKTQSLSSKILVSGMNEFPVYGEVKTFSEKSDAILNIKGTGEVVGIKKKRNDNTVLLIGFDFFQEIRFLLLNGQPAEYAHLPTIELYIETLRGWILNHGIPLVEIPPIPANYNFIACLTHDVDFPGIRFHKFDRTMFGFVYRALIGSVVDLIKERISLDDLLTNWMSVFILPAVYLGIAKDFWNQIDHYREIEEEFESTFYIIPFKNKDGKKFSGQQATGRATRYDILDIIEDVKDLIAHGCEVGVHGLDAWRDHHEGRKELERIKSITGESKIGVRMHWLYYNHQSPELLEQSGFCYDSSMGYNETIGYRGGTVQVFKPVGTKDLFELPLHIQDTALFFSGRMGLNRNQAWPLVMRLLDCSSSFGGVLTINWHCRSLGPERLWGDVYLKLLKKLKNRNAWFGTASQVVQWFKKRRSVIFNDASLKDDRLNISIDSKEDVTLPDLVLRVYKPKSHSPSNAKQADCLYNYSDIIFSGSLNTSIVL